MRTLPTAPAAVVVLNATQTQNLVRNADVANEQGGLDLINAGDLPDADIEALGLNTAFGSAGPANRPDPVDIISIGGREITVDQISNENPSALAFKGNEIDLVA